MKSRVCVTSKIEESVISIIIRVQIDLCLPIFELGVRAFWAVQALGLLQTRTLQVFSFVSFHFLREPVAIVPVPAC